MAEYELDGHEAGVNNLLEHLYLDSNREYQHDFGPRAHEGPVRRRNTVRQSFIPRDGTARRPEATLIAQLASHTDAVTAFAVSPDHLFFVSSSDDKTVKVWDTARLERNVTSKPRFSYAQHQAKIKAVCMLEGVHCFASAADDGSLHVVRVHVSQGGALPRYTKINAIREHRTSRSGEYITCMTHYDSGAPLGPPSHTLLMFLNSRIGIQSCVRDNTFDNMPSGFTYHAGFTHYGTSEPQWTHYGYVSG
jgi:phosphoinositide-3-kinase regulatory subunit 4